MTKDQFFHKLLKAADSADHNKNYVTKQSIAAMFAEFLCLALTLPRVSAEAGAATDLNSEPAEEPDTPKRASDSSLQNDSVERNETTSQLEGVVSISATILQYYARYGVFPATRKGRLLFFSSAEIIKKIKSCYAVQNEYVPGNRLSFLYSVKLAQKDNPNAAFLTATQMSKATRISTHILLGWRKYGLKSYKLPSSKGVKVGEHDRITRSGTVLLSFEDIIDFLKKGGMA